MKPGILLMFSLMLSVSAFAGPTPRSAALIKLFNAKPEVFKEFRNLPAFNAFIKMSRESSGKMSMAEALKTFEAAISKAPTSSVDTFMSEVNKTWSGAKEIGQYTVSSTQVIGNGKVDFSKPASAQNQTRKDFQVKYNMVQPASANAAAGEVNSVVLKTAKELGIDAGTIAEFNESVVTTNDNILGVGAATECTNGIQPKALTHLLRAATAGAKLPRANVEGRFNAAAVELARLKKVSKEEATDTLCELTTSGEACPLFNLTSTQCI